MAIEDTKYLQLVVCHAEEVVLVLFVGKVVVSVQRFLAASFFALELNVPLEEQLLIGHLIRKMLN
jgi:hypothetical protein